MRTMWVRVPRRQPSYAGEGRWCDRLSYKEEKLCSIHSPGTSFQVKLSPVEQSIDNR
jgi:hypothetical protein